jgi:hypothetical protein
MMPEVPGWALRAATAEDLGVVREAHGLGRAQVRWPDLKLLRVWAARQGWPAPRFGFEKAFLAKMLESEAAYRLAIEEGGIEVRVPRAEFTVSPERLAELDALYGERSAACRATGWGVLVEDLREIRRAVEAGVAVKIEGGPALRSWQEFYEWAHGRYHMLEEGADHWIGDDKS